MENAAEDVRDNAEMKADNMEDAGMDNAADMVRDSADAKADAMEEAADAMPAAN